LSKAMPMVGTWEVPIPPMMRAMRPILRFVLAVDKVVTAVTPGAHPEIVTLRGAVRMRR